MMARVLIVDDEEHIIKGVKLVLEHDGMECDTAHDGQEALDKALSEDYDIILLDLMLPKVDGYEVCQRIREKSQVPIIMLTAKGDDMDKIMGLEYGADDYITKPFNVLEVRARVKAILRRTQHTEAPQETLESGDIRIDTDSRRLFIKGKEINLTSKEFEMLYLLVSHPGKVYSRDALLKEVWGEDFPGDARTVDVHIRRLREKIEPNPSEPKYVHTKWGLGYYYQK
ncbi:MAG: response regulator transcription factor [Lachnospiraceae bacterium]|nr:response regulator transcription factor [Lachnospiraceae bacterium]